jgi:lipoprotein-anchoring transpeptidase ErfK/SrfK
VLHGKDGPRRPGRSPRDYIGLTSTALRSWQSFLEPAMHAATALARALVALPLTLSALSPPAASAAAHKHAQHAQHEQHAPQRHALPESFPADATQHIQQLNADTSTPSLKPGDKGPAVIRAQVLLDRNWFSVGEIDGNFGSNMKKALAAFQASRNLPATGRVDPATWQALGQDAPAFATYVLTEQDVNGPYVTIPKDDLEAEAQLPALGYESAAEAIGERFHMSPKLLAALNKGRIVQPGQAIVVTDVGRAATLPGAGLGIRIVKSEQMLYLLDGDAHVVGAFPVTIGGREFPLPDGMLQIMSQTKNPAFSYDPSLLREPKTDKKLQLPPGPNGPIGVMWLALSQPHLGIHGTAEPSQMSRAESSGCVRLTNWDVVRLSSVAPKGTMVEVQS